MAYKNYEVADELEMLSGVNAVTTVHEVTTSKLATHSVRVAERSPAVKVDVDRGITVHIDVQIARCLNTHIVESRVGRGAKAVVLTRRTTRAIIRINTRRERTSINTCSEVVCV